MTEHFTKGGQDNINTLILTGPHGVRRVCRGSALHRLAERETLLRISRIRVNQTPPKLVFEEEGARRGTDSAEGAKK